MNPKRIMYELHTCWKHGNSYVHTWQWLYVYMGIAIYIYMAMAIYSCTM